MKQLSIILNLSISILLTTIVTSQDAENKAGRLSPKEFAIPIHRHSFDLSALLLCYWEGSFGHSLNKFYSSRKFS